MKLKDILSKIGAHSSPIAIYGFFEGSEVPDRVWTIYPKELICPDIYEKIADAEVILINLNYAELDISIQL